MSKFERIIGKSNLNQLAKRYMDLKAPSTEKPNKPKQSTIKITLIRHLDPNQKFKTFSMKGEKYGKFRVGEQFGVQTDSWNRTLPVVKILEITDTGGRWLSGKSEYVWRYAKD